MFKMTGALLIASAVVWFGFAAADRLRRRRDFLTAFGTSLTVLETEIEFGRYELKRIFEKLDGSGRLFGFYGICASEIEDKGIKKAWSGAAKKAADAACLNTQDKEAILALGHELGMSDVSGQKKTIERCAALIAQGAQNAESEYARLAKVYRSCGILAGAFVVLMFI